MDLQHFINNNTDYLSQFRKLNLNVKKYSQLKLAIVTYKRNVEYDFIVNRFIKWCKGAIINTETNKLCVYLLKVFGEIYIFRCAY